MTGWSVHDLGADLRGHTYTALSQNAALSQVTCSLTLYECNIQNALVSCCPLSELMHAYKPTCNLGACAHLHHADYASNNRLPLRFMNICMRCPFLP